MKKYMSIDAVISKIDQSEITQLEYEYLTDLILYHINAQGYMCGGGFGHHTEEEMNKIQKE